MAITSKWRQHIEAWQRGGLSQAEYCAAQQINVRTFAARLSDYRKLPKADSVALISVGLSQQRLATGPKIIVFDYQAGRGGRHARHFLQDWHGQLMVDDYGGYKALFAAARAHPETRLLLEPCIELACWTHARRKFFDLFQASQSPVAQAALQRIGALYAI